MSSLRCINVKECSIGDEEVLLMAHGCPPLIEICLSGCDEITDASLMALGRRRHQLISLLFLAAIWHWVYWDLDQFHSI